MSPSEIERLRQLVAGLTEKRYEQARLVREIQDKPAGSPMRARLRIFYQSLNRIEREIHMHEREIERLRGKSEGS